MSKEEYLKFYLQLLEMEIAALRSVISEIDFAEDAKDGSTQWLKAEAIDNLKNSLVRP